MRKSDGRVRQADCNLAIARTFFPAMEADMWRTFLISLGFASMTLAACDQQVLIAQPEPGSYEVMALVAD